MTEALTLPGIRRGTITVLSFACGIAVANVYIVQPLLASIARDFAVSEGTAGLVATAAQIGYALGIGLVVPLADTASLRRLAFVLPAITAAALFLGALAPSASLLALITGILAVTTVLPQIIMPTAAALAAPGRSGRVVGAVSTGLILGILLSRVVSGALAELTGSWRTPFAVAGVLTAGLAVLLPPFMPARGGAAGDRLSYGALLASLPGLFRDHAAIRLSALLGASVFAAFAAFWSTLAFHLAAAPYHLGPAYAGLFGLLGAPGALLAPLAGRLSDRHGSHAANLVGLVCVAAAFLAFAAFGSHSLLAIVIGCNLLDCGVQSGQIANQARIFALGAAFRGRVNTIYMVCVFSGGAVGSLVGVNAYGAFGWAGVCAAGSGFIAIAAAGLAAGWRGQARRPEAL